MLHRSYSLLSFIRRNVICHCADRLYVFHIGVAKKHTSIFITSKYVHVISKTQKIFNNNNTSARKIDELRWIHASASRFIAGKIEEKSEKIVEQPLKQKVIEHDKKKLGKVKERDLEVKAANLEDIVKKDEKFVKEKKKEEKIIEKEIGKDENLIPKKGMFLTFFYFCSLLLIYSILFFSSEKKSETRFNCFVIRAKFYYTSESDVGFFT